MPRACSVVALVRRLRRVSKAQTVIGVLAAFLLSAVLGVSSAFFLLLLLVLPAIAFFARIAQQQAHYEITDREVGQLVTSFLGGMFPGAIVAVSIELVIAPLFAIVCFYDQRESLLDQLNGFLETQPKNDPSGTPAPPHAGRIANVLQTLEIQKTFGFYVFILLSAYVAAGVVEEATKLWIVQGTCVCNCSKTSRRGWLCDPRRLLLKRVDHANHHVVIALAVTAAALGFATLENAAFTLATPTFRDGLQVAVLRSVLSLPLHGVCGAITGIRLARVLSSETPLSPWRQKTWVLYPSVLVHGSFDLQVFLVSAFVSSDAAEAQPFLYDLLIPGVLALAMLYGAFKLCHHQWRELEAVAGSRGQYAHLEAARNVNDDSEDEDDDGESTAHKRSGVLLV